MNALYRADDVATPTQELSGRVVLFMVCLTLVIAAVFVGALYLAASSPRGRLVQDRQDYEGRVIASKREWAKPAAHAIYHLALPYLTDREADGFQQRLDAISSNYPELYEPLMTEIAEKATHDRENQLFPALDERQQMILELHLAYMGTSSHDVSAYQIEAEDDLDRLRDSFNRSKKKLVAAMVKYSERYPPTDSQ